MAYIVKDWPWWQLWIAAYVISGTFNQNLFTAQHEISHFLAFRKPFYNKLLALAANLPLIVPVAVKFREYHHDHHLFLGVDGGDVDLPTVFESTWITSTLSKAVYGFFYILVYGVRPLVVRPKNISTADIVNWVVVISFDLLILYLGGLKPLVYLLAGSIMGGGLHPMAGHLLAEHYMFEKGQETYSYYGPLNALSYNVGYHNEHHDFPQIPHTRLHKLRKIAPEYYEPLYHHTSWCWVVWKFLTDPAVGPWSRMHRPTREGAAPANEAYTSTMCKYAKQLGRGDLDSAMNSRCPSPDRNSNDKKEE
jgi:sphingolipid delta-4 desaturase